MNFLKTLFASICLWSGLGSAALAIPVQFSYTGNPLDLSVLEDWEQAWVEQNVGSILYPLRDRVEIVLEVDCDITGGVWSCGEDLGHGFSPTWGGYQSGDLTLVSSTFQDVIRVNAFKVDAAGQVVEWEFVGSEGYPWGGGGDFTSSHTGDFWGWYGLWPSDLLYSAYFYCEYTYGYAGVQDWWSDNSVCSNGEPVQYMTDHKIDIVGTGVWTVDTGEQLIATPLPAGLSLLLGGLGGLAWLRRRQPGRAGA